jgi:polyhydroxybutyrate depolymerase
VRLRAALAATILSTSLSISPFAVGAATRSTTISSISHRARTLNQLAPGDHTISISVGGQARSFILHVPPNPPLANRPLILVYHGADDTALGTSQETDFEQVADANGDVVAFLQGYENTWNNGAGNTPAQLAHINDVAFTKAVIAEIERLVSVDSARIAATGFSNGALMVQDLGCLLASQISLIVPVEGELPKSESPTCAPSKPISVYEIHGTADTAIPYNGGYFVGVAGATTVLSATASVARWAHLDVCRRSSSSRQSSTIVMTTYSRCKNDVKVQLQTIEGGTHEWPSNIGQLVVQALGQ